MLNRIIIRKNYLSNTNCFNCIYLSKRPGVGNYFIYKCSFWGIISQNILPHSVVINSIGEKCDFFKEREIKSSKEIKKS